MSEILEPLFRTDWSTPVNLRREFLQVLFARVQPAGRKNKLAGRKSKPAGRENKPAGVKMNLQEKLDQGKHTFKNLCQQHQQTE